MVNNQQYQSTKHSNHIEHKIRVILVDDHEIARQGLRTILSSASDIQVIGEAANFEQMMDLLNDTIADVALIDIQIPGKNGIELAKELQICFPQMATLLITGYQSNLYVAEALNCGIPGLITKDSRQGLIINAVRVAANGGSVWENAVLSETIKSMTRLCEAQYSMRTYSGNSQFQQGKTVLLSPKQLELIKLVACGLTNKQIGSKMGYSEATVKKYLSVLMYLLGVSKRTQVGIMATHFDINQ